jgi:nitroimidazol reductase NimA-like FMN-containing flavoprotein (pyridoxamine 5'-phosphate oxidase superfamily)
MTDHRDLIVLSVEECNQRIQEAPVGRVAFMSKGEPLVLPVNHALVDGVIAFRTSIGEKLDAADRRAPMSFEVDDWDASGPSGWSVVVRGVAERVDEPDEIEDLEALGLVSWASPSSAKWIRIRPTEVTGRALR